MKQLILNFLFFVGAAFIFIQCAKFFPTNTKASSKVSKSRKITNHPAIHDHVKNSSVASGYQIAAPAFKTGAIRSYFNSPAFPLNMMEYIKGYSVFNNYHFGFNYTDIKGRPLFYNPYISYTYYQLFGKRSSDFWLNNALAEK
jgi:hypothetical protein